MRRRLYLWIIKVHFESINSSQIVNECGGARPANSYVNSLPFIMNLFCCVGILLHNKMISGSVYVGLIMYSECFHSSYINSINLFMVLSTTINYNLLANPWTLFHWQVSTSTTAIMMRLRSFEGIFFKKRCNAKYILNEHSVKFPGNYQFIYFYKKKTWFN